MKSSWKTTVGGAITALGAYLLTINDPSWLPTVGKVLTIVGPIVFGLFARDNDKTSEQVGAK